MSKKRNELYCLTLCAILTALSVVLSQVKVFEMPYGGSVTLFSMLAATLTGYFCGPKWGMISGVALGVLNIVFGGYILHPAQVMLDYILAFGALGLAGFFQNKKYGLYVGYVVAILGRFFFSFLSGIIFYGSYAPEGMHPWLYSFVYNILYIAAEGAITLVILALPPVKNTLAKLKQQMSK